MKGKFESIHSIQITEEGVTKLLKKLNPHKTPGPDNITPGVSLSSTAGVTMPSTYCQYAFLSYFWVSCFSLLYLIFYASFPDCIQITEVGVTKLLKKLNPHKTPGPDNITPGVLKELATLISGFRKGLSCDTRI
jgi:hypothetical protein